MRSIRVDDEIVLRIPEIGDAPEFYALIDRNRDHLGEWLDFVPKTTDAEVTRRVIERWQKQADEESSFNYIIEYQGSIVGSGGATRLKEPHNVAEIGYWLAEDMQGRGIITRVCRTLVRWLFEERHVNRVEALIAVPNRRSRAVAERLGFKLEGVLRETAYHYGDYCDTAVYSMLAREYSRE